MKTNFLILFLVCCLFIRANAQDNKVIPRLLKTNISDITTDHENRVFLADRLGNIKRYDEDWKPDLSYAPRIRSPFSSIDATSLKILGFSKDQQQLVLLDRFLSTPLMYSLANDQARYYSHFSRGNNNAVWVFDQTSFEVSNIDYLTGEVLVNFFLNKIVGKEQLEIGAFLFRNHTLFIHVQGVGAFLFDNQGNLSREIRLSAPEQIGFDGRELFYLVGNEFHILHLDYVLKEHYTMASEKLKDIQKLIKIDRDYFFLSPTGIYEMETLIGH